MSTFGVVTWFSRTDWPSLRPPRVDEAIEMLTCLLGGREG